MVLKNSSSHDEAYIPNYTHHGAHPKYQKTRFTFCPLYEYCRSGLGIRSSVFRSNLSFFVVEKSTRAITVDLF